MPKAKYKSSLGYATVLIVISALVAELIGMVILHHTGSPHSTLIYLDSLLMVVFLLPAIYFFVYRPMKSHIKTILNLNSANERALAEFQITLQEIKALKGILPIYGQTL